MSEPLSAPGLNARAVALEALAAVLDRRQQMEAAFGEDYKTLAPSDRAFAQLLVKTALRRLGQLDALLAAFMESPLPPGARDVRHLLRLGMVQLLFLGTPPHAGVHSSVELAKSLHKGKFQGLVNAVLKRAAREGAAIVAAQDAALLNTPTWLWTRWAQAYGEEGARAVAASNLEEPPLDITVKNNALAWTERLGGEVIGAQTVRLRHAGNVPELPGYAEGAWWVQDASAALPAQLLIEAMGGAPGKRMVDLCAAPGGKTAQLASAGARVTALDISTPRMKRLKENLARLQLNAECVIADALQWRPDFTPDAILLDAPCSATGTIRRHPEIARLRTPEDIIRLAALQQKLLRHAFSLLSSGGWLCYAVCSTETEEGQTQIRQFLYDNSGAKIYKEVCFARDTSPGDGFYIALIQKNFPD